MWNTSVLACISHSNNTERVLLEPSEVNFFRFWAWTISKLFSLILMLYSALPQLDPCNPSPATNIHLYMASWILFIPTPAPPLINVVRIFKTNGIAEVQVLFFLLAETVVWVYLQLYATVYTVSFLNSNSSTIRLHCLKSPVLPVSYLWNTSCPLIICNAWFFMALSATSVKFLLCYLLYSAFIHSCFFYSLQSA